jgi:hypothetical protein
MGTRIIVTKLVLDGESDYKQKIASISSEYSLLSSKLKQVEEQYKGQANSMEALTAKGGVLHEMLPSRRRRSKSWPISSKTPERGRSDMRMASNRYNLL